MIRVKKWVGLALMAPLYLFTVGIRVKVHTEPFQLMWCTWVFAQGYCAAIIGYLIGKDEKDDD